MGAALLNFMPGKMTFEQYFGLVGIGMGDDELALRFLLGLSPAMLQRKYVADPTSIDLAAQRGPSTVMACQLCAGIAATEALKILLGRGKVHAAPVALHFDAYRGKLRRTRRLWGNRNPLQRLPLRLRGVSSVGCAGSKRVVRAGALTCGDQGGKGVDLVGSLYSGDISTAMFPRALGGKYMIVKSFHAVGTWVALSGCHGAYCRENVRFSIWNTLALNT